MGGPAKKILGGAKKSAVGVAKGDPRDSLDPGKNISGAVLDTIGEKVPDLKPVTDRAKIGIDHPLDAGLHVAKLDKADVSRGSFSPDLPDPPAGPPSAEDVTPDASVAARQLRRRRRGRAANILTSELGLGNGANAYKAGLGR